MRIERYKEKERNKIKQQFENANAEGKLIIYYKMKREALSLFQESRTARKNYYNELLQKKSKKDYINNALFGSGLGFYFSILLETMVNPVNPSFVNLMQIFAGVECFVIGLVSLQYISDKIKFRNKNYNENNKLDKTRANLDLLINELDSALCAEAGEAVSK